MANLTPNTGSTHFSLKREGSAESLLTHGDDGAGHHVWPVECWSTEWVLENFGAGKYVAHFYAKVGGGETKLKGKRKQSVELPKIEHHAPAVATPIAHENAPAQSYTANEFERGYSLASQISKQDDEKFANRLEQVLKVATMFVSARDGNTNQSAIQSQQTGLAQVSGALGQIVPIIQQLEVRLAAMEQSSREEDDDEEDDEEDDDAGDMVDAAADTMDRIFTPDGVSGTEVMKAAVRHGPTILEAATSTLDALGRTFTAYRSAPAATTVPSPVSTPIGSVMAPPEPVPPAVPVP